MLFTPHQIFHMLVAMALGTIALGVFFL